MAMKLDKVNKLDPALDKFFGQCFNAMCPAKVCVKIIRNTFLKITFINDIGRIQIQDIHQVNP